MRQIRIHIGADNPAAELAEKISKELKRVIPGDYRIIIEKADKERTDAQNRFYWAILNDIAEQTGNDNEDLHTHFKARFLQDHATNPARIKSTTELNVMEFNRYIDKILEFVGSQYGIVVNLPREF